MHSQSFWSLCLLTLTEHWLLHLFFSTFPYVHECTFYTSKTRTVPPITQLLGSSHYCVLCCLGGNQILLKINHISNQAPNWGAHPLLNRPGSVCLCGRQLVSACVSSTQHLQWIEDRHLPLAFHLLCNKNKVKVKNEELLACICLSFCRWSNTKPHMWPIWNTLQRLAVFVEHS